MLVLKNESQVQLDAFHRPNGKVDTFPNEITAVPEEYSLWKSVKMIVAGTTNEKHGNNNWIVILLQIISAQKKLEETRFIGGDSTSHNIEYPFIREVVNKDKQIQKNLKNGKEEIPETAGWRYDMIFFTFK